MMGRFINGDDRLVDNGNMFAYCENNPVMNVDPTGHAWWNAVWNYLTTFVETVVETVNAVVEYVQEAWNEMTGGDTEGYSFPQETPQEEFEYGVLDDLYELDAALDELAQKLGMSTMSQGIMFSSNGGVFQGSFILGFSNDVKGNFTPFFSKASGASSGIPGMGLSNVLIFTDAESINDLKDKAKGDGLAGGINIINGSFESGKTLDKKGNELYNTKSLSVGVGVGGIQAYHEDSETWNLFKAWND